jgi:hypothetical protein
MHIVKNVPLIAVMLFLQGITRMPVRVTEAIVLSQTELKKNGCMDSFSIDEVAHRLAKVWR